ncbi:MAG: hypothetical protein ACRDEA_20280, partial [Microcystaceae cyanobacterium]
SQQQPIFIYILASVVTPIQVSATKKPSHLLNNFLSLDMSGLSLTKRVVHWRWLPAREAIASAKSFFESEALSQSQMAIWKVTTEASINIYGALL